jgi:hypothetical protein
LWLMADRKINPGVVAGFKSSHPPLPIEHSCLAFHDLSNCNMGRYILGIKQEHKVKKNRIGNLLGRVSGAFSVPTRQKIELEYLNQSVSINDLERRQREISAGKFHSL